jgi:hypothetical protein
MDLFHETVSAQLAANYSSYFSKDQRGNAMDAVNIMFSSPMKPLKDSNDYTFRAKVPYYDGKWSTRLFDTKKNLIFPMDSEDGDSSLTPDIVVPKLSSVISVISVGSLYFNSGWGISPKLIQAIVQPQKNQVNESVNTWLGSDTELKQIEALEPVAPRTPPHQVQFGDDGVHEPDDDEPEAEVEKPEAVAAVGAKRPLEEDTIPLSQSSETSSVAPVVNAATPAAATTVIKKKVVVKKIAVKA